MAHLLQPFCRMTLFLGDKNTQAVCLCGLLQAKIAGLEEELEAERANRSKVCIFKDIETLVKISLKAQCFSSISSISSTRRCRLPATVSSMIYPQLFCNLNSLELKSSSVSNHCFTEIGSFVIFFLSPIDLIRI